MTRGTEFGEHRRQLERELAEGLERWESAGGGAAGVVFDAGLAARRFRDDLDVPFHACPHFARWAPDPGPGDLLCVRPGRTPRWLRVVPRDYWHEPRERPDHPAVEAYAVEEFATREQAVNGLGDVSDCAYVGPEAATAERLGIPARAREPESLLKALDWRRAYKTAYEIGCIRDAASRAARGHRAAGEAAAERGSEYAIHLRYLEAAGLLESETPYPNIVAWDAHAAILHYQTRRRAVPDPGHVFLIDAGARCSGYACDVTRTYAFDAPDEFVALLRGMETLQAALVAEARPGVDFVSLHAKAVEGVGRLLAERGLLRASVDEACAKGWVDAFLPHGLGHHLGLQVHDVGGWQVSADGERRDPPERWPYLRTTRELEPGQVVTIEPGLYFIPSLLEPLRSTAAEALDWDRVRSLVPCGGIRIEDDVWITDDGPHVLTRGSDAQGLTRSVGLA